jgi:hypothetical protein
VEASCFAPGGDSLRGIVARWVMASIPSVGNAGPMGRDGVGSFYDGGCSVHHGSAMEDTHFVVVAGTNLHGGGREGMKRSFGRKASSWARLGFDNGVEINVDLQPWSIGGFSLRVVCGVSLPRS